MADARPQVSGVLVGTDVKVGVSVGGTVAVLVAGAVGDLTGAVMLTGAPQPAKTDRNNIQE